VVACIICCSCATPRTGNWPTRSVSARPLEQTVYDLVVVGGGLAGLAAGGLWGLRRATDGGAGAHSARRAGRSSMRIENYLGFPPA